MPAKAEEKQIFNTFEKVVAIIVTKQFKMLKTHSEEQRVTAKE